MFGFSLDRTADLPDLRASIVKYSGTSNLLTCSSTSLANLSQPTTPSRRRGAALGKLGRLERSRSAPALNGNDVINMAACQLLGGRTLHRRTVCYCRFSSSPTNSSASICYKEYLQIWQPGPGHCQHERYRRDTLTQCLIRWKFIYIH